jgi:hypothetical protein
MLSRSEFGLMRVGVVVAVVLGALFASSMGGTDAQSEIVSAVHSPYNALLHRDAKALCADFTPDAVIHLAQKISSSTSCEVRVSRAFGSSAPFKPDSPAVLLAGFKVTHIALHGDRAKVLLSLNGAGRVIEDQVVLQHSGGRWRVATPARLVVSCSRLSRLSDCPSNSRVLVLVIGSWHLRVKHVRAPNAEQQFVAVPVAVRHAGGHVLRDFQAGMHDVAESGCLACHRLGEHGNNGPGSELTHIGSKLSVGQIEHALVDPSEPMPSFKDLPAVKFKDVVKFLSLLR